MTTPRNGALVVDGATQTLGRQRTAARRVLWHPVPRLRRQATKDPDGVLVQVVKRPTSRLRHSRGLRNGLAIGLRWPDFGRTARLKAAAYCASVNSIPPDHRAGRPCVRNTLRIRRSNDHARPSMREGRVTK